MVCAVLPCFACVQLGDLLRSTCLSSLQLCVVVNVSEEWKARYESAVVRIATSCIVDANENDKKSWRKERKRENV